MNNIWYSISTYRFNNIYYKNFEKSILKAKINKKKFYTKMLIALIAYL